MSLQAIERVLGFWLDQVGPKGWYVSDDDLDAQIRDGFLDLCQSAAQGGLLAWRASPRGALAYLILTDQFPRNVFRGTGQAFASDANALKAAKGAICIGHDMGISEPARQFFYLPLMHSESLADQDLCICRILTAMPETGVEGNLPHAVKHRDVIRQFGRFPSRNAALGRKDTEAELAYRAQGGYMS